MSIVHAVLVRDSGLLKGATYLVGNALAMRADKRGVCWPGVKRLAFDTRLSERAVRGAIKKLSERGLVFVDRDSRKTNSYQLNLDAFAAAAHSTLHTRGSEPPMRRHNFRRACTPPSEEFRDTRQLTAKEAESIASKYKENKTNIPTDDGDAIPISEIFEMLELRWNWQAEHAFATLANTFLDSGVSETWFVGGRPKFVLFSDPSFSQGPRCDGVGLAFSPELPSTPDLSVLLGALWFGPAPVWSWSRFINRLVTTDLPLLQPVASHRIGIEQ